MRRSFVRVRAVGLCILPAAVLLALMSAGHASPPGPSFSVSVSATPSSGTAPLFVDFSVLVLSGTPTTYDWSFGDGHYLNGTASPQNASPAHEYSLAGTYDAFVTVWEGSASTVSAPIRISVGNAPLLVAIHASRVQGPVPLHVLFNASATGGTGTFVSFVWSFGDGGSGTGTVAAHTFASPGIYHVGLTVTDSSGDQGNTSIWVNVVASAASGANSSGQAPYLWVALGFVAGAVVTILLMSWLSWKRERALGGGKNPSPPRMEMDIGKPSLPDGDVEPGPPAPDPGKKDLIPTAGGEPPSVVTGANGATRPVTLSQRVLVHLASQGVLGYNDIAPRSFTQAGIAGGIGVRQNVLTTVLKRMEGNGLLTSEVSHVKGEFRRLKVYRLTPKGEILAREYRGKGGPK